MKYILPLLLLTSTAYGQQEPLISMYWNTAEYYNPAATGVEYKHRANVQYRNQWTGINGAPTTAFVSYGAKVDKLKGGIGISGAYDHIGNMGTTKVGANYSYHLQLGESVLGLGIQAGILTSSFSGTWTPPQTADDPLLEGATRTEFNAAAGLFYKWKNLTVGASATQLGSTATTPNYDPITHYWFTGAYEIDFAENFQLTPSFLVQTEGHFYATTVNVRSMIHKQFWAGVSYRNRDSYAFMAGYDFLGKFRVGYCYETTVSRLNNGVGMNTHEAVLGFLLK